MANLHAAAEAAWVYYLGGGLLALGVLLLFVGWSRSRVVDTMEDTPTTPARACRPGGTFEVVGVVECAEPLRHRDSPVPLVWYRWREVEAWEETGGGETRDWEEVKGEEVAGTAFYVRDRSGRVRVDPTHATVDAGVIDVKAVGGEGGGGEALGETAWSSQRRRTGTRREVQGLTPGQKVYVLGAATEVGGEVCLAGEAGDETFRISHRSEARQLQELADVSPYLYGAGLLSALVGAAMVGLHTGVL